MLPNAKVAGGIFQAAPDWSPAAREIVRRNRIQVRAISVVGAPAASAVHMFAFRRLSGKWRRRDNGGRMKKKFGSTAEKKCSKKNCHFPYKM